MPNKNYHLPHTYTVADERNPNGVSVSNDPYLRGHGAAKVYDTVEKALAGRAKGLIGEELELFSDGWREGRAEIGRTVRT